jgi:hypothetical protein
VFAFPATVEESDENLGQLLTVLESRDEAILGATDTLAAAQGVGIEAAEDEDQDMVCEEGHLVPLVGASSILMRIWWSEDGDESGSAVA